LADSTINLNINEGKGSSRPIGKTKAASGIDETKLASKIGKVYEKVSKDTNASLVKNLNKELDKVLTKLIREIIKYQGPSGKGSGASI